MEFGVRYSELLRLPYFDPVRTTIIDPMHCFYRGVAKCFIKERVIEKNILSRSTLKLLQTRVNSVCTPSTIGRIPHKIESQFGSLTAVNIRSGQINFQTLSCMMYCRQSTENAEGVLLFHGYSHLKGVMVFLKTNPLTTALLKSS